MQIMNLIKTHEPVFFLDSCVFTLCCRIIYKLPCFSHWLEAHTQGKPILPNTFTLTEKGKYARCLLEQPNTFICFFAPTSPSAQPRHHSLKMLPLLKVCDLKTCFHIKPVPQEQKAKQGVWMWLQTGCRLVPAGTDYLWQQSSPLRGFPWENQETNAMTTGISLMLSRSAQGGFLFFFSYFQSGIVVF